MRETGSRFGKNCLTTNKRILKGIFNDSNVEPVLQVVDITG